MGWAARVKDKLIPTTKHVEGLPESVGPTGHDDEALILNPRPGTPIAGTIAFLAHETGRYSATWYDLWRLDLPGPVKLLVKYSANIANARNECVENMEGDWILWVDDDHRFAAQTLRRLLSRREAILQPVVLKRYPPFEPVMFGPVDPDEPGHHWSLQLIDGEHGVKRVHAVGAGLTLVRRFVFERMDKPWYRYGEATPTNLGEDLGFCRRAREAGFISCVDLDTPIGHLNAFEVWPHRDEAGNWSIQIWASDKLIADMPFAESDCVISPEGRVLSGSPGKEWTPAIVRRKGAA